MFSEITHVNGVKQALKYKAYVIWVICRNVSKGKLVGCVSTYTYQT